MIDYIKGKLTELNPTYAVVEAAGTGYEINITLQTYTQLQVHDGQEVKLYTSEIIREDTHSLFGFLTKGERALFVMLLTVSGIGANTARMIMSAFSAAEVRQIIATGNARALSEVKGLGPKTAQRVIVDLKDKILKTGLVEGEDSVAGLTGGKLFPTEDSPVKSEAVSALTMLGFNAAASGKAVDKIIKQTPDATVEQVIRTALKML